MWKGPKEDGITQSLLCRFIRCPFSFYIYTILGLEDPKPLDLNLIWGDCFHKGLEYLVRTKDRKIAVDKMLEHLETNYPTAPPTYKYSLPKMLVLYILKEDLKKEWITEEVFEETIIVDNKPVKLRGKKDGICYNGDERNPLLLEHKCKGYIDPIQTKRELREDIQCNLYMNISGAEWVLYDLIKIPDNQKYGPAISYGTSPAEYIDSLYRGPIGSYGNNYPIYQHRQKWIHQGKYHIPREQQQEYWDTTLLPLIRKLQQWYEYVTEASFDYQNPECYNEIFYKAPVRNFDGRTTEKFECEYHSYLIGETDLEDLAPVSSFYSELEDL